MDRLAGRFGQARVLALLAFVAALIGAALIARHLVWLGLAVVALALLVLAVTRRSESRAAAEVLETVALAALPFSFVLDAPVRALAAVFLMFGLAALAAAALKFHRRYIGVTDLFLVFVLVAVFPAWFGIIAYVSGVVCFIAAGAVVSRSMA